MYQRRPNESEYVHFAHVRRHLFAWRGPNKVINICLVSRENEEGGGRLIESYGVF